MVALPDPELASTKAQPPAHSGTDGSATGTAVMALSRALRISLGMALVMISLGLWIVSPMGGDVSLFLIKLVFAVTLLCLGTVFLMSRELDNLTSEIQVDPVARQIRVTRAGKNGQGPVIDVHDMDALADVSLYDSVLTARGADGQLLLALHISDTQTEAALRRALMLKA